MMLWKNRNSRVGLCVTLAVGCLMLVIAWAVLVMPKTAMAGKPEVLRGSVTFRDHDGDKIRSDGGGAYIHNVDLTEVGLEGHFSVTVNLKKNAGRTVDVDLPDDLDPACSSVYIEKYRLHCLRFD